MRNTSFSLEMPAFFRMLCRVPFLRGLLLCTGTGIVIFPSSVCFWYIRWLPVCFTNIKSSFSIALQSSCPLTCGSLPIYDKLKFLYLACTGKMRDIFNADYFNIACSSIFKHINGFFDSFAFCCYIKLRAVNYITAFFGRTEFSSDFYFLHIRMIKDEVVYVKNTNYTNLKRGTTDMTHTRNKKGILE